MSIVRCEKCKKRFNYDETFGICPKCGRFFSTTSYNESDAYLDNILSESTSKNCSYHGEHYLWLNSGHDENLHKNDNNYVVKNNQNDVNIIKQKEETERRLREKYTQNPPKRENNVYERNETINQGNIGNSTFVINRQTRKRSKTTSILMIFRIIIVLWFLCMFVGPFLRIFFFFI